MTDLQTFKEAADDYEVVRQNLEFLREHWREQPSLEALAARNDLSAAHLQRLFMRWAGLSPKAFVQALTIDHARKLLRDSASVLEATYEVGLSGPGFTTFSSRMRR
jgi:AraC family transcriptional regulator of adaptative response/methylated-DNA-[protein]-cysteine methyltransferase